MAVACCVRVMLTSFCHLTEIVGAYPACGLRHRGQGMFFDFLLALCYALSTAAPRWLIMIIRLVEPDR